AALRAAIGGGLAEKRATRGGGDRAPAAPNRGAPGRRQGAHGGAASGGLHHRHRESGRAGITPPCSSSVLVLEPRGAKSRHRQEVAIGRRFAVAPTAAGGARRTARAARARDRGAILAAVTSLTLSAPALPSSRHGGMVVGRRPEDSMTTGARPSRGGRRHLCGVSELFLDRRDGPEAAQHDRP